LEKEIVLLKSYNTHIVYEISPIIILLLLLLLLFIYLFIYLKKVIVNNLKINIIYLFFS